MSKEKEEFMPLLERPLIKFTPARDDVMRCLEEFDKSFFNDIKDEENCSLIYSFFVENLIKYFGKI